MPGLAVRKVLCHNSDWGSLSAVLFLQYLCLSLLFPEADLLAVQLHKL